MERVTIKANIKLSRDDLQTTRLEWADVIKGRTEAGSLLSAFDVFLVSSKIGNKFLL